VGTELHLHGVLLDVELQVVTQGGRCIGNRDDLLVGSRLQQDAVVQVQGAEQGEILRQGQ
jgi:hypothetical protein